MGGGLLYFPHPLSTSIPKISIQAVFTWHAHCGTRKEFSFVFFNDPFIGTQNADRGTITRGLWIAELILNVKFFMRSPRGTATTWFSF